MVVLDNLSNSSYTAISRIESITGVKIPFYKIDIRNFDSINDIMDKHRIDSCIHFAGLKAVGESFIKPWEYYENNITAILVLIDALRKYGCKNIIFSSSATVYGNPEMIPITEDCKRGICTNPYGWMKWMIEQMLFDLYKSDK